jgi:hypothetical protein
MKENRKSQISVEYAMIIGLIITALAIAVGVAFYYSGTARHQIGANQIDKIGRKIIDTSDSIYYLGYPSKATIDLTMPEDIINITVYHTDAVGGDYILFRYKGSGGDSYAIYNTKAELDDSDQSNRLNNPRFITAGLKHLVINVSQEASPKVSFTPKFD